MIKNAFDLPIVFHEADAGHEMALLLLGGSSFPPDILIILLLNIDMISS